MEKEHTIELKDFAMVLGEYLNSSAIADCCPNGLQIEGKKVIKKAATAVSANLEAIEKAIANGCDALVVHHGLFWKGDDCTIKGAQKQKIKKLLEKEISLLAYHLPLDIHREVGNNWKAAADLGWENLASFGLYSGIKIGVKGTFSPMPIAAFMAEMEAYYEHQAFYALGGKNEVSSAALVSGGAYKLLKEAAGEGIDCFITGNFDEPAWNEAHEEKVNFLALGHTATEKIGPKALAAYIEESLNLPCPFFDTENPF